MRIPTSSSPPGFPLRRAFRWGSTPTMVDSHGAWPEETVSRDERAEVQQTRLRELIDRLLAVGGVQGERLREAGVGAGADVTLDDLPKLPFTTKQDLWDSYPDGMLAVPKRDVVAVHGSSG